MFTDSYNGETYFNKDEIFKDCDWDDLIRITFDLYDLGLAIGGLLEDVMQVGNVKVNTIIEEFKEQIMKDYMEKYVEEVED